MRNQLASILAPLTILVTAHARVDAHPATTSPLALAVKNLNGDICAPYEDIGYCYEVYLGTYFPSFNSGPQVIVIQPIGGKYVQAFGRCSDCRGAWYTKGSAIVGRTYMGKVVEAWQCKGRYELGINYGSGHCHRIE